MDIRKLSIMRTGFSYENQRAGSETIDAQTEQITLKWTPEQRKNIASIRSKYRSLMTAKGIKFYGLSIVKDADIEDLTTLASQADHDMKTISPELQARVMFIPLFVDQEAKGEVYQMVLNAIQYQIYTELFGRLKKIAQMPEVPKQSRTAMIKLCDKLLTWNVVDDPNINETINNYKLMFQNDVFKPIMAEIKNELIALEGRCAFLEFEEAT